jgi:hypothetical protein
MSTPTTGRARHLAKRHRPLIENFVAFARALAPIRAFLGAVLLPEASPGEGLVPAGRASVPCLLAEGGRLQVATGDFSN